MMLLQSLLARSGRQLSHLLALATLLYCQQFRQFLQFKVRKCNGFAMPACELCTRPIKLLSLHINKDFTEDWLLFLQSSAWNVEMSSDILLPLDTGTCS